VRAGGNEKGAVIVIDPDNGDLLASVTYPFSDETPRPAALADGGESAQERPSLLDRARFGLYPPGSSFKLVTAAAALEGIPDVVKQVFECKRLPDGRVGNVVRGWGRPVRDDVLDTTPHGSVDMARGIVVSCNAYFAQLGTYVVGAERLMKTAELFGINVASPNTAVQLRDALPQAAYGQGQVVATPLQMARVAGAIAGAGKVRAIRVAAEQPVAEQQVVRAETASALAGYMRGVVTGGTGQVLAGLAVPVAGKTGTAELRSQPSHAWFVGFAPYGTGGRKRIAFAVIVENGRYGGRVAAPIAGAIVTEAARLGLIQ
jgi:peptidoglycan glycosyltransferase